LTELPVGARWAQVATQVRENRSSGEGTAMPYRLRWEGHGVYRRFYGVVTAAEFLQAYDEMTSDIRFEGTRYIISDYLECTPGPDLTEKELEAFAKLERLRFYDSPDTVQANVASDPRTLKYALYYESLRVSPYCIGTFSNVADARQWIAGNPRLGWVRPPLTRAQSGAPELR
jgi:hypothetical protein